MKVKELIEELQTVDPESDLAFWMNDGCCGDTLEMGEPFVDNLTFGTKSPFAALVFPPFSFLASCRRASAAKSAGTPSPKYKGAALDKPKDPCKKQVKAIDLLVQEAEEDGEYK